VQHTQDRFRDAFYKPMISDWRNYESWQEGGSPTAVTKTTELAKTWLEAYRTPAIDETAHEELKAFVQRRVSEGGVATDF
jgi:trimethylamine--corrinoid protein Co-methyltransferase